jgi:hypothetical protein
MLGRRFLRHTIQTSTGCGSTCGLSPRHRHSLTTGPGSLGATGALLGVEDDTGQRQVLCRSTSDGADGFLPRRSLNRFDSRVVAW